MNSEGEQQIEIEPTSGAQADPAPEGTGEAVDQASGSGPAAEEPALEPEHGVLAGDSAEAAFEEAIEQKEAVAEGAAEAEEPAEPIAEGDVTIPVLTTPEEVEAPAVDDSEEGSSGPDLEPAPEPEVIATLIAEAADTFSETAPTLPVVIIKDEPPGGPTEGGREEEKPAPPPDPPAQRIKELIEEMARLEAISIDEDRVEFAKHYEVYRHWQKRAERLGDLYTVLEMYVQSRLMNAQQDKAKVPEETQARVQNLQEALDLAGRMLARRKEFAENLAAEAEVGDEMSTIDVETLASSLDQTEEAALTAELKRLIKAEASRRWDSLRAVREAATSKRKGYLEFIERNLLPCIDPTYEGPTLATDLDLSDESVAKWFTVYGDLQKVTERIFSSLDIVKMQTEPGHRFDEQQHMPLMTDPNSDLDDELITAVKRLGYLTEDTPGKMIVLRPASVIVAKRATEAGA